MKRSDLKIIRRALRNVNTHLRSDTSVKGAIEIRNIRDRKVLEEAEDQEELESEEFEYKEEKQKANAQVEEESTDDNDDNSLVSVDVNRM